MMKALLPLALLLAAAAPPGGEKPKGGDRQIEVSDDLLDFSYGWPAEAAAIPKLSAQLEADLATQQKKATAQAGADKAERTADNPFNGHYFAKHWSVAGRSQRLLTLVAQSEFYSGGAHGNSLFHTILWDRTTNAAMHISDIFADEAAAVELVTPIYCTLLNKEREKKRGEPVQPSADKYDMNGGCPDFDDQEMALFDENGDGRFEVMRMLLPPYVAGPYAEGPYEIDIPVTPEFRALVKKEYRASF